MILEGCINYGNRRVRQMYLFGADGAAALITQLIGLGARAGGPFARELQIAIDHRWAEMP